MRGHWQKIETIPISVLCGVFQWYDWQGMPHNIRAGSKYVLPVFVLCLTLVAFNY